MDVPIANPPDDRNCQHRSCGTLNLSMSCFTVLSSLQWSHGGHCQDCVHGFERTLSARCSACMLHVVDFPGPQILVEHAWDPRNLVEVAVPCHTAHCEKNCCSIVTIPLGVCKAISVCKSQGLTLGKGQFWECLVASFGSGKGHRTPGLEHAGVS